MQRDLFDDDSRDTISSDKADTREAQPKKHASKDAQGEARQRAHQQRAEQQRVGQQARTAHADQSRVQGHSEPKHMGQATTERPQQSAAQATPKPDVIEAEVVEEVAAARPHQGDAYGGAATGREKLLLVAFVSVLIGGILLIQGQTKALQSANFEETPNMNVPVVVRYAPIEQRRLSQDEEIQVSFAEIKDNAAKLQQSVKALSRPKEVPHSKVLNQQDYQAMRTYLARKENITNESDVRDILLQAGYTLPARLPEEEVAKKRNSKDHVAFARDVINRILKDEVEDFLEKVQIASEVGVYVADTAQE